MIQNTSNPINLGAAKLAEILQDLVSNITQDDNGDYHIPQTATKAINAALAACDQPAPRLVIWWEGGMPGYPQVDCPEGVDYEDWVSEKLGLEADAIKASASRPGGTMADATHQLALACAELVAGARAGDPAQSFDRAFALANLVGIDYKALDAEEDQSKAIRENSVKLAEMIAILDNFGQDGDQYTDADLDALEAVVVDLGVAIPQDADLQVDASPAPSL